MSAWIVGLDADGWIEMVGLREEEILPAPTLRVDEELANELMHHDARVAAYRGGQIVVPHDDRLLWQRLRADGFSGPDAVQYRHRMGSLRQLVPDDAAGMYVPPAPRILPTAGLFTEHAFTEVPGLRLLPMTSSMLDTIAPIAAESGVYSTECRDGCQPPEAHVWLRLAERLDRQDTWQLVLEYSGRPLQIELLEFFGDIPTIGLTVHLTRERPHWFWREAERPVFDALRDRGYTVLRSRTRNDRPDWIAALKQHYSAVEIGQTSYGTLLEYPLEAPGVFQGWPVRKTAGPGWTWTDGTLTIREATAADVPALRAHVTTAWGANQRVAVALQVLEEWWALDHATILLGTVAGQLMDVRLARFRKTRLAGNASATPWRADPTHGLMARGVATWLQTVGYDTASTFLPVELEGNQLAQRYLALCQFQRVGTSYGGRFAEYRQDITAALTRPRAAWTV
jgi:hypothetical protein